VVNQSEPLKSVDILWSQRADPPQRYTQSYSRYLTIGGCVRPDEYLERFLAANPDNATDMARFYFFCLAQDQIVKEGIEGDIAELGVYKGGTATVLATIARRLGRTAYLLDTYEGFDPADLTGIDAGFSKGFTDTSLATVRALVGEENTRFVKGYFPQTASEIPEGSRFCLVHIDCDLYAPLRSALEYFYPRMAPGGYLIIHDYSSLHWGGAEKAVDEFFADKVEPPIPLPDCGGSVVIRKARQAVGHSNWIARKRLSVLTSEWASAGGNGLGDLLGKGWSAPEKWGIWGVGESHELRLFLPSFPSADIEVEANVNAALIGSRTSQEVDVLVGGRRLATWQFTRDMDRGVRQVRIPLDLVRAEAVASEWGIPAFIVEFRPRFLDPTNVLDPSRADNRVLGLGLVSIRLRAM
jgi:hypothetical protein